MVRTITFSVYLAPLNPLGARARQPPPPTRGDTHPADSWFATMRAVQTDRSSPSEPVTTGSLPDALFRVSARVIRGLKKCDVWGVGG